MTDAIAVAPNLMKQISRASQLETILALVQQQQTFQLWQSSAKRGRQLRCRTCESLKCNIQRGLRISGIGKSFDLDDFLGQLPGAGHFLQLHKSLGQQWG